MRHLPVLLAFVIAAYSQVPRPGVIVGGSGGGGGTGAANATATSAPAVTSLAVDVTALNLSSVNQAIVQCWSGTAAPYSPVTITSLNPTSLTSITANFTSTANVTCRVNATGTGPTGSAGATGPAGANGTNGTNGAISQLQDEGSNLTVRPTINFTGAGVSCTDDAGNSRTNCAVTGGGGGTVLAGTGINVTGGDTVSIDSTITDTRDISASGIDTGCVPASGSGSAFTCNPTTLTGPGAVSGKALVAYTNGMVMMFRPDAACSGAATINVSSLGAKRLYAADGTTNPTCSSGLSYLITYNTALNGAAGGWVLPAAGGGSSGDVVGPASSVDSAVALYDGTTGKLLKGTASAGTSGQVLTSNGAGVSPSFQTPTTGATKQIIELWCPTNINSGSYSCNTSSMTAVSSGFPANGEFPNTGTPAVMWPIYFPSNWNSATAITVRAMMTERSGNSGTYQLHAALRCMASGATFNSAFNTADYGTSSNTGLVTRPAGNQVQYVTMTSVSSTGCVAGELAYLAIWRNNGVGTLAGGIAFIMAAVEIGVQ